MKRLHITEYSKFCKLPIKESYEHDVKLSTGNIIRTSVQKDNEEYKTDINKIIDTYNKVTNVVEDISIPLTDIIIYDNLDIADPDQELAYVLECPVCLNTTVATNHKIPACPQCGNAEFPFTVKALVSLDQMEELAIDNKDETSLIIIKDGEVKLIDEKSKEVI